MKRLLILGLACGCAASVPAQAVFRATWQGVGVQPFSNTSPVTRFSVSGPDGSGYVYLKSHSTAASADIIRAKWQGIAVQDFLPTDVITGFETSGPDFEGYVTLTAVARDGSKGDILKTRWLGTGVQAYSVPAGEAVIGFTVSGPDPSGYVVLSAVAGPIGVAEPAGSDRLPRHFALTSVLPNPAPGAARISYSIPRVGPVSLSMYDCSGKMVAELFSGEHKAGFHQFDWTGTDSRGSRVGTGVYFITMNADGFQATRKIVLVK